MVNLFYLWMSVFGVALLGALWFFGFQPLFLDLYRFTLFSCREDILALVESGEVPYTDEAYRNLRSLINGLIRYGHRLTLAFYVHTAITIARTGNIEPKPDFSKQLDLQISRLNPHAQAKMSEVRRRMYHACLIYLLGTSLVLQCMFVVWLLASPFRPASASRIREGLDAEVQREAHRAVEWDRSHPVAV